MKKVRKILLRIGLSAFFIYLTFATSNLNISQVYTILKSANPWYFVLIILLIILNYAISTYRWRDLLLISQEAKPKYSTFLDLYFIGSFFNNFLVTSIGGDAYKIFKLGKRIDNNAMALTATFMDRFTGFLLLVLISYLGFLFTWKMWFDFIYDLVGSELFTYVVIGLCLGGFWLGTLAFFLSLKMLSKKINFAKKLHDSFVLYKAQRNKLAFAMLTSLLVQLCAIFSQYFVFSSLGYTVPLGFALFVLPVITLAGFFIPSINGIGVQDLMYKELFKLVGVPPVVSLSASILYHFLRLSVSLIGGLLYATGKAES
jgi:uncharacterized protein (TIRG00374 family)